MNKRTISNIGSAEGRVIVWLADGNDPWSESIVLEREEALNIARAILDVAVKPVALPSRDSEVTK